MSRPTAKVITGLDWPLHTPIDVVILVGFF